MYVVVSTCCEITGVLFIQNATENAIDPDMLLLVAHLLKSSPLEERVLL